MLLKTLTVVTLTGCAAIASAQSFPLWERILKRYSGQTDATPVPSMKMGHMQMSLKGELAPGDEARAAKILEAAAEVVAKYRDVDTALRDGYKPFFPTGKIGEEIHYTNYRYRRSEQQHIDCARPGSILYERRNLASAYRLLRRPKDPAHCGAVRADRTFWSTRQHPQRSRVPSCGGIVDPSGLELDDSCLSERATQVGWHGYGDGSRRVTGLFAPPDDE